MGSFLPVLTPADWAIVIATILVPVTMMYGIYAIRREMRHATLIKAKSVQLKTRKEQRLRWRREDRPREVLDLLDDVETLVRLVHADEVLVRREQREAARLTWLSYRVPVRMALMGGLLLAGVFSTVLVIVAQGPSNPIP
jgi:hypothetical protein